MSEPPADRATEDLVDRLVQLLHQGRGSEVPSIVGAQRDPLATAAAFNATVKCLYRRHHDVVTMIIAGTLGLAYCHDQAALVPDKAMELKMLGKAIAFNTAVNCWPGWGDAGIVITGAEISRGLQLALASRDLVRELALGPRERGTADWLVGALELAAGHPAAAGEAFARAEAAFTAADPAAPQVLLAQGYGALACKAQPQSRAQGAALLEDIVNRLRLAGSKEAAFFAGQLVTADKLLLGSRLPGV
jgi:hypothetical protein